MPFRDSSVGRAIWPTLQWGFAPFKHTKGKVQWAIERSRRKRVIADYLRRDGFRGLQIGSGKRVFEGWINSDIIEEPDAKFDCAINIERRLPFPDNCLDAIYGSEVIEHIRRERVEPFFREAFRVLRRGGVLRLTTPDPKAVCELYLGIHEHATLADHFTTWLEEPTSEFWLNSMFRSWGHQWLWERDTLKGLLHLVGFSKSYFVEPQETMCGNPQLQNREIRYGMPPPRHAWTSSMIVEAIK